MKSKLINKEWFEEVIELQSENTYVKCPLRYKDILTNSLEIGMR